MKSRSAKNKGVRLQNNIREVLYQYYPNLRSGDIKTAVMGESGTDIILSPTAKDNIPFDIEAKNQESISIWKCLEQAETNTERGRIPLLVFKRNRSKTYACLEFEKLLELLKVKEE